MVKMRVKSIPMHIQQTKVKRADLVLIAIQVEENNYSITEPPNHVKLRLVLQSNAMFLF